VVIRLYRLNATPFSVKPSTILIYRWQATL